MKIVVVIGIVLLFIVGGVAAQSDVPLVGLGEAVVLDDASRDLVGRHIIEVNNCGHESATRFEYAVDFEMAQAVTVRDNMLGEMCRAVVSGGRDARLAGSQFAYSVYNVSAESIRDVPIGVWMLQAGRFCSGLSSDYGYREGERFSESVNLLVEAAADTVTTYEVNWYSQSMVYLQSVGYGETRFFIDFRLPYAVEGVVTSGEIVACETLLD